MPLRCEAVGATTDGTEHYEVAFRRAARAVAHGRLDELRALLAERPELARARSPAPYRATLLHHTAANGVPDGLQRPEPAAPAVARLLLDAGAEPDALSAAYGGGPNATTLCLVASSWHPFRAGVQAQLLRVLVEGGAAVDGVLGDGAPLTTALTFGYTRAAEELVALGARTDSAVSRAGLGDVDGALALLDTGDLARALGSYAPALGGPRPADLCALVQECFHVAVTHGRLDVMAALRERGAGVDAPTPGHHCALPLLQALFVGEDAAARWLLRHGADADLVDPKRGEPARRLLDGRS